MKSANIPPRIQRICQVMFWEYFEGISEHLKWSKTVFVTIVIPHYWGNDAEQRASKFPGTWVAFFGQAVVIPQNTGNCVYFFYKRQAGTVIFSKFWLARCGSALFRMSRKANRRPTDPTDTTRHDPAPLILFFENRIFSTKIGELEGFFVWKFIIFDEHLCRMSNVENGQKSRLEPCQKSLQRISDIAPWGEKKEKWRAIRYGRK